MVLCVDEKSQVQALARSQPAFPMMPGMPEKTHPRLRPARHHQPVRGVQHRRRHGDLQLHRRYRTIEFRKFLIKIDSEIPAELDIHLVCDNYGTHKTPIVQHGS